MIFISQRRRKKLTEKCQKGCWKQLRWVENSSTVTMAITLRSGEEYRESQTARAASSDKISTTSIKKLFTGMPIKTDYTLVAAPYPILWLLCRSCVVFASLSLLLFFPHPEAQFDKSYERTFLAEKLKVCGARTNCRAFNKYLLASIGAFPSRGCSEKKREKRAKEQQRERGSPLPRPSAPS